MPCAISSPAASCLIENRATHNIVAHMADPEVFALILAGGAGTRFWPASRAKRPKQLLPLVGASPLLAQTAARVLPLCAPDGALDAAWRRVFVATGPHLAGATSELLPELPRENILVEPAARNTAPCIAWASAVIARHNPDAVIIVLPSDHHVADEAKFRVACRNAIGSAQSGVITTLGIAPTHAETGYGYIEVDRTGGSEPREVKRFIEKPDRARAEAFFESGKHLWNAGLFFFRAADMLAAVDRHLPDISRILRDLDEATGRGERAEAEALEALFPQMPNVSIDVGVMEKEKHLAVVPASFGWSDVGSFQSAWELANKDDSGNALPDGALALDASGNLALDLRSQSSSRKRVIALLGVHDLVVIETDDALLVAPRARAQDVKLAVEALKQRGDGELT